MPRFWFSRTGVVLVLLGTALIACVGWTAARVARLTHPARPANAAVDLSSLSIEIEPVAFPSTDGLTLTGWWMPAGDRSAKLILCHDKGQSKETLVNLAIMLREAGFSILLFDFRGHGQSAAARTTYGAKEMRDVLGAMDFIDGRGGPGAVGLYGAGMGAYAAVLAAASRPTARALVLDGLYPDVRYRLAQDIFGDWRFARKRLAFLPQGVFELLCGVDAKRVRARDAVPVLAGRQILLLAPADDTALVSEMRRMYESVPDDPEAEANFTVLPGTLGRGLFGERVSRYHARVLEFFRLRLAPASDGA